MDVAAGAALVCLAAVVPLAVSTQGALPQARTIKLINPYPPGGTADIIARLVTEQIGRTQGVTFVIENRPGAGTVIGADVVARAAPDGNTLLLTRSAFLINAHMRKLNFDPFASFEPICNLSAVAAARRSSTAASPLKTHGRPRRDGDARKPGEVTIGEHRAREPFADRDRGVQIGPSKLVITYVPYPGNAPTVNAVLGGHVTAGVANYADVVGHFCRPARCARLITLTPKRASRRCPNLPTAGEAGCEGARIHALVRHRPHPPRRRRRSSSSSPNGSRRRRQAPEVTEKLAIQGLFPENGLAAPTSPR